MEARYKCRDDYKSFRWRDKRGDLGFTIRESRTIDPVLMYLLMGVFHLAEWLSIQQIKDAGRFSVKPGSLLILNLCLDQVCELHQTFLPAEVTHFLWDHFRYAFLHDAELSAAGHLLQSHCR